MESWGKISFLLCVFGFLKEFRPSEPYITPYLLSSQFNLTSEQIAQDVYPISIYANMLSLIIVFLVTDLLRYKMVIVMDAISGVCIYFGLTFFNSLFAVQVVEVLYGLFMAGEVAYYTYIYAKVDKEHFQEVTSYTRSAYLAGRALSGIFSQIVVYFSLLSYYHLQWITMLGLLCATVWAIMLPSVNKSMYFYERDDKQISTDFSESSDVNGTEKRVSVPYAMQHLWSDFSAAFTNTYVVKWVIWWSLSTCGYWQVISYIQLLWQTIRDDNQDREPPLYGLVEAAYTLIGAMASMIMGKVKLDWAYIGETVLAICAIGVAILLLAMGETFSMAFAYISYIGFTVIYHTMITVANSEVAKHVNKDSYGLIFGFTTFSALVLQTGLTYAVNKIFQLPPRAQFRVYGLYYAALGVLFFLVTLTRVLISSRER